MPIPSVKSAPDNNPTRPPVRCLQLGPTRSALKIGGECLTKASRPTIRESRIRRRISSDSKQKKISAPLTFPFPPTERYRYETACYQSTGTSSGILSYRSARRSTFHFDYSNLVLPRSDVSAEAEIESGNTLRLQVGILYRQESSKGHPD